MNILLLEDDEIARIGFSALIKNKSGEKSNLFEFSQAKVLLSEIDSLRPDIAFIDLDLEEDLIGLEVLAEFVKRGIYCVVLTGHDEDEHIIQAYELGAKDYLVKPAEEEMLDAVLHRYEVEKKLSKKSEFLRGIPRSTVEELKAYSFCKQPILLTGETGVGKTRMANNLHQFFQDIEDREIPFVSLNCNELNESLIESEIFGHVKGAFTGATTSKSGLLDRADGGILFIDEIGSISESVQKKLLTVLEKKSYFEVGGEVEKKVDFILISATCDNLNDVGFRKDLYQRIKGIEIVIPSFRDLSLIDKNSVLEDILKSSKRRVVITNDARELIFERSWDGNIRELQRYIEKLISLGIGVIDRNSILSKEVQSSRERLNLIKTSREEMFFNFIELVEEKGLPEVVNDFESFMINYFYEKNEKKARKTISILKLSNNQFYKVIKK